MDFQHWLRHASGELSGSESPKRDAEILLEYVTGKARTYLLAFGETELTAEQEAQLAALLARRKTGEPVAHLVGEREFWSLPLFVSAATLIPRPDTECLVEQALARLPAEACRILDLGTGTGAIALALASERPDCAVTAVDVMPDAVALAQRNVERLGLANVTVLQSSWFSALEKQTFGMIVSNPPYIDGGCALRTAVGAGCRQGGISRSRSHCDNVTTAFTSRWLAAGGAWLDAGGCRAGAVYTGRLHGG